MSNLLRNEDSEQRNESNRTTDNSYTRSNLEGFEGMNYEQIRQPYHPDKIRSNRDRDLNSNNDLNKGV